MKHNTSHHHSDILNRLGRENHFVIPANYFEELPEKIHQLTLQSKAKNEAFNIPEHYFIDFEARMLGKIQLPLLHEPNIPSTYFDDLPQQVQERIWLAEQKKNWRLLPNIPQWSYAIAASLALLIGILVWKGDKTKPLASQKNNNDTSQVCLIKKDNTIEVKVTEQTQNQIEKHVNEQLIEHIDESVIIDELAYEESTKTENDDINEINNYLIDNDVEESLIEDVSH
jgi:hypothetical protein